MPKSANIKDNKDFLHSLDLTDHEMEEFIPFVLQDLWELGSIPEYIYQLINDNVEPKEIGKIIDFGCGKGAVLVYLAKRLDIEGVGIDLVPEFIDAANQHAIENSVNKQLHFITGDLLKFIDKKEKYDIVIYGYASEILGNVKETILQLQNSLNDSGYIILEIAITPENMARIEGLPTENELLEQLGKTSFRIIDKIFWDIEKIRTINRRNNEYINNRIQDLKAKYPDKTKVFDQYMINQLEECNLIENHMVCSTWILRK